MSLPGRLIHAGGHRVFVHRSGRGRPLVLVHGYLVSHWQFRDVVPDLAANHEVIAIDLPGFGESDRPSPLRYGYDAQAFSATLVAVLDALGLDKVTLLGHSMGGGVALYTAARRPERVERVVAIDPLVYPFALPLQGRLALAPVVGTWLFRALSTRALVRRTMTADIYHDPAPVTDEWVDYVWERMNRPGGHEAAVATMRFVADPAAVTRNLRAVRAPTLVVWGEDDRMFPAAWAARLCGDVPGAEARVIPACGHSPVEERPAEFLRAAAAFLGMRPTIASERSKVA